MTGSNQGDGFDPNAGPTRATPGWSPDDSGATRHDGMGPTDFSTTQNLGPTDDSSDDSTRTFAAVRGDDATQVYDASAMPSAYPPPDDTADTHHYLTGSGTPSARPEERFITGSTIDDNAHAAPMAADEGVAKRGFHIPVLGGWLLGVVRILIGWQFFWAFLDKTFGLGWSTVSENAWVNGGKPTQGYLTGVVNDPNNPFASTFEHLLGQTWVDWLFMIGLLGIGIVLILGLGKSLTWFASICGIAMYLLMYLASWPAGHRAGGGVESAAVNPFLDDHLLNAVLLLALAVCNAGAYLGMAKAWRSRRAFKDA